MRGMGSSAWDQDNLRLSVRPGTSRRKRMVLRVIRVPSGGSLRDTCPVEKLRDWFGTPVAAGKTLVWLCWVWLLVSVLAGLLYASALGVLALFT